MFHSFARRTPEPEPVDMLTLPVDAVLALPRLRGIRATLQRLALRSPDGTTADHASADLAELDRVIAAREALPG